MPKIYITKNLEATGVRKDDIMGLEENRSKFEYLIGMVNRDGIDRLMDFIHKSDFYTAPASTRFHGSYEGGLLAHSLNVYENLNKKKNENSLWNEQLQGVPEESIIISSLLHDICKTYYYIIEFRNKKINGVWEQVPFYTVDDKVPYGHGEKSVMMIEEYMKLTPQERYAIRWHMGPYSGSQDWLTLGTAFEKYPLALALFEADMEATHILEKEA